MSRHNPELVIATLNDTAKFELELTIERGRGYVSATQNRNEYAEAGQIPIDSIYSPVLKVSYRVDATRAGERTDFDKLVLDVETKSAISPRDAVASAAKTLTELFGLARELNVEAEGIEIGPAPVEAVNSNELSMPIEDLDLSVRSYNCLKREGINTVSELVALSETQLMNIRNFGQKSVDGCATSSSRSVCRSRIRCPVSTAPTSTAAAKTSPSDTRPFLTRS